MTIWILLVLALWVGQTFLITTFKNFQAEDPVAALVQSARGNDAPPELKTLGARAARAQKNLSESLPVFLAVALLLEMRGVGDGLAATGAATFFIARVVYVPAYLIAILGLRTLVWAIGSAGLAMMVTALIRAL